MTRLPSAFSARCLSALLLLCAALLRPSMAQAQADAQFSQYYEVPAYYNAGAIGLTDMLRIRGGGRLQWVGVDNAPKTFMAAADMPFKFIGKRWGVGLLMEQESIGLYKTLEIGAQLAYKQKLFGGMLSIGLQAGFLDQSFKGTDVVLPDDDYHQGTDEGIPTTDLRGNAFDFGLGLMYTHRLFWAGFSATHINSPSVTMNAEQGEGGKEFSYEYRMGRALYFMAGSNIAIKNTLFEVLPSTLVRLADGFFTFDATARLRYNKFLTAGIGYRWKDTFYATLSAETKGFFIGIAYDYSTSAIAKASSGTYEVFAGYSLKLDLGDKNRHKHKSVRIL